MGLVLIDESQLKGLEDKLDKLLTIVTAKQVAAETLPKWLTRKRVAQHYGVALRTVDNWANEGKLLREYPNGGPLRFDRDKLPADPRIEINGTQGASRAHRANS
jgi:hypothetical protein